MIAYTVDGDIYTADPQTGETRALLAYCGLSFEEACLKFHETERAVRTASSEQGRRPIFTEGLDQWRNYKPWIGELQAAAGAALVPVDPDHAGCDAGDRQQQRTQ